MRIFLKSVLARFKVLLGAVPLIATTYTIGTLVQPRASFAISQNRDNLSLVNTVQVSTQTISQQSYNVNKNNLELKHSNYFILSQNQGINSSQNSQLKNFFNVVPTKNQGGNFPNQWKTTNTNTNNKFGIEKVNNPQLAAPVNPIVPRPQPMLTNVSPQPVAPTPVNPIRPRPQPMLTNVPPQPVAPTPVNPIRPRPQPMLINVPPQPVVPQPVHPMILRPQPTIKNLHPVPPAPQPIVKNPDLVTPAPQLQPTSANPYPIPLATQPIVKNPHYPMPSATKSP